MLIIIRVCIPVNLFVLFCSINYSLCENESYCNSKFCNNSMQHVMCQFQSPDPARDCINYEKLFATETEKQKILHRINSRRNKISSGEIRSLPPAENMLKLEWSEELEVIAQRWADQCFNNFTDVTKWCHDLENSTVGQVIGTIYGDAPGLTAASIVDLWYMELLNMNASYLGSYTPSTLTTSEHYDDFTQLIWAESSRVGCGGVKYKEIKTESHEVKNRTVYRLICNFSPSGNIIGQAVYSSGIPCSRCPQGRHCDAEYQFLCSSYPQIDETNHKIDELQSSTEYKQFPFDHTTLNGLVNTNEDKLTKTEAKAHLSLIKTLNATITNIINDNDTYFDFLSHLFDITSTEAIDLKPTTLPCKDILAIEDFIELLKNKLKNDQSLKDLLLSSNTTLTPDSTLTDRTVAAIVNQLYSKKETTTISITTEDQNINSTLLADLVEAVIFRPSGIYSTTEENISLHTQIVPNVIPIKIQAQLGEVQANAEFTGHYFFPEEEEKPESDTTEAYTDLESSNISEISLEIDELKKNRATKDFLEEILESDLMTEIGMTDRVDLNNNVGKKCENNFFKQKEFYDSKKTKRIKRKLQHNIAMEVEHGVYITYNDLLKQLAADIRLLKLNEIFFCSSENTKSFASRIYRSIYVNFYFNIIFLLYKQIINM